jgi:hypothetical protein
MYISKKNKFDIEVYVTAIGEIKLSVETEGFEENFEEEKHLTKEELKKMIDDLTTIYEEIKI